MKWKKVENVSAETVHVEKATTDETAQYTTALARLRNEKNVSTPCKYFYFNNANCVTSGLQPKKAEQ